MSLSANCWEFMRCGCEEGGINAKRLGVCPAVVDLRLDGANGGKNAGRSCWVVSGTFCPEGMGKMPLEEKIRACVRCPFYDQVVREEGDVRVPTHRLLRRVYGDAVPDIPAMNAVEESR